MVSEGHHIANDYEGAGIKMKKYCHRQYPNGEGCRDLCHEELPPTGPCNVHCVGDFTEEAYSHHLKDGDEVVLSGLCERCNTQIRLFRVGQTTYIDHPEADQKAYELEIFTHTLKSPPGMEEVPYSPS